MNRPTLNLLLAAGTIAVFTSSEARADNSKKVCVDAYEQAQTLRDAGKPKEAREQLRICSQATCKAFIVKDCTAWLVEMEGRVASVVLSAKDAQGQPQADVAVSMDGASIAQKLDGQSIEVDPGHHTFTFVASDGTKVEQPFTVLEGQKAQSVVASIPTAASVAALKAEQQKSEPAPPPPPSPLPHLWTTRRKIALGTAGVGVVGVAVGSVFGLMASSKWSSSKSECPAAGCAGHAAAVADHDSAASMATVSTVAFAVGGVALATGVVLFFTGARTSPAEAPTGVVVVPTVGAEGPGLVAAGVF